MYNIGLGLVYNMKFGEYISEKRLENNISIRTFAKTIGISPSYLCEIEKGVRTAPRYEILLRIKDAFALDANEMEMLMDMAAESKNRQTVAEDIVSYICKNKIVYQVLRTSLRNNVDMNKWENMLDIVSASDVADKMVNA